MDKKYISFDIIIGSAALIYDWGDIVSLPVWLLPVVIICPLYPFLLAAAWWQRRYHGQPGWLYAFATVPPAMYGVLAVVFYPMVMAATQFSWINTLAMVWVWLYAGQAWYLLKNRLSSSLFPFVVTSFCALSTFAFQLLTNSYGYLAFDVISNPNKLVLLVIAVLTIVGINVALLLSRLGPIDRRPRW